MCIVRQLSFQMGLRTLEMKRAGATGRSATARSLPCSQEGPAHTANGKRVIAQNHSMMGLNLGGVFERLNLEIQSIKRCRGFALATGC